MRRVATPMTGGLATSAFLTLEVLPVLYTLWRQHQLRRANRLAIPIEIGRGRRSGVGPPVNGARLRGVAVAIAAVVLAPGAVSARGDHVEVALDDAPTVYVCPMHPEVTSDKPGRCPKCHMQLEPRPKRPSP